MIKQLSKVGNSTALILDKTLMDLCHLEQAGTVDIQVENGALIIRAASQAQFSQRIQENSEALMDRFADTYTKLAE